MDDAHDGHDTEATKALAGALFNGTWDLLMQAGRTPDDDARMIHMAHASTHHWSEVGTPVNSIRGEWQCSRVYAVLQRAEPARFHAQRCLALCERHVIGGFDLAIAYEAMARASAVAGDDAEARHWAGLARAAAAELDDPESRDVVLTDLDSIPFGD